MGGVMLTAVTAVIFAAVGLLAYGLLDLVFSDDQRVTRRLRGMTEYERAQVLQAEPMLKPFSERIVVPTLSKFVGLVRAMFPKTHREALRIRIVQAGESGRIDADRFFAAQMVCALGGVLLMTAAGIVARWRFGSLVFIVVIAAIVAFMLPDLWLRGKRAARKREIIRELPDMLDMLTISVEAGLGFDAALSKLVRNSRNALSQEFGRMLQEVQAGSSRKQALRALAERIDVSETSTFVTSIIQADMFGVSISKVLRTQAGEMRLKRRQHAEEEAQQAPVKMVIPLVTCILPATMIVIMGPAAVRIWSLFAG